MNRRKIFLLSLMVLSIVPFLIIPVPEYGTSKTAILLLTGHFASRIGLIGGVLLLWSYLLGIRRVTGKLINDQIWVNRLHRWIGTYGYLFILLHPALIIYSISEPITYALFAPKFIEYELFVSAGRFAFQVLTFIWVTSALLRGKLSYRLWKIFHYATYIILPLLFIHGLEVGSIITSNDWVRIYWIQLAAIFSATVFMRILFELGIGKEAYKISAINQITHDIREFILEPVSGSFSPAIGQYAYISRRPFGESHPFTISRFDEDTKQIGFAIKTLGKFTAVLGSQKVGDILLVDGPYGVFTTEIISSNRTPVMIAGGIGITPFLRLLPYVKDHEDTFVIFGNKTLEDIPFKEELESALGNKLVHVLSNTNPEEIARTSRTQAQMTESQAPIETGFVTIDLLKKYLGEEVERYEYFICGPPIMMKLVSEALYKAGVAKDYVHMEKFSL